VTTGAAELSTRPQAFRGPRHAMPGHRMPTGGSDSGMTTAARSIDGLVQHEELVRGVGVMTDDATGSAKHFVDMGYFSLPARRHQLRHVAVTAHAEIAGSVRPELALVRPSMGIMTESAATEVDWRMEDLFIEPGFFTSMTAETKVPYGYRRHADTPGLD
jgi:hypothetical protein